MSSKPNLLVINKFHEETIEQLDKLYTTHHLWSVEPDQRAQFLQDLEGQCKAAATASWNCDPLVYDLKSLEFIACFGVGVDGIDFDRAGANNINISNTPDVLNEAVADLALLMLLGITRNVINADHHARSTAWQKTGPLEFGEGIQGKTLGILGLGRIGEAIAARATPFGVNICYHNRNKKNSDLKYYDDIMDIAEASDILLCVLPGGPETKHIINKDVLQKLGPTGYFLNIGRGSSVDEEALGKALENNEIAGAALDVYEKEPNISPNLLSQKNVMLLPHIGSATVETRRAMGNLVIENLSAYFSDEPLITPYSF